MKTARLFMTLLAGAAMLAAVLFMGCSDSDDGSKTYAVSVTAPAAGGTVTADKANPKQGETVTLTAAPAAGYEFGKWIVESGDITLSPDETANPATFTMPAAAVSVKAEFVAIPPDVYVAGYYYDNNGPIACYWKNGVRTDLAIPQGTDRSNTNSITVENGKIYITGQYRLIYETWYACYWEDGECISLDTIGTDTRGSSITVVNGVVYVAGYSSDGKDITSYLWTDGVRSDLAVPTSPGLAFCNSVVVSGTDVYVGGSYSTYACYWKNGVLTTLFPPPGTHPAYGSSMDVMGDAVYVSGYYIDPPNTVACQWKGNVCTALSVPTGTTYSIGRSVVVFDGIVYIAGQYKDAEGKTIPCYWKGSMRTDLPVPVGTGDAYPYSIAVSNGNVYIAGAYKLDVQQIKHAPCLWANGEFAELPIPAGTGGQASSVVAAQ